MRYLLCTLQKLRSRAILGLRYSRFFCVKQPNQNSVYPDYGPDDQIKKEYYFEKRFTDRVQPEAVYAVEGF